MSENLNRGTNKKSCKTDPKDVVKSVIPDRHYTYKKY